MKITAIIMLTACLHVSAGSFSQNVTLKVRNASLKEVFASLQTQSGYYFICTNEVLNKTVSVTADIRNEPLSTALNTLFKDLPLTYFFKDKLLVISNFPHVELPVGESPGSALLLPVTGRVFSEDENEPLEGINITVKGSMNGTVTDKEGNFLINVPEGSVLVFSGVGFKPYEYIVKGSGAITIRLQRAITSIDEQVVIAYGTSSRRRLTGAISTVKMDERIAGRALASPSSALAGLAPGLSVSQNSGMAGRNNITLLIRGLGTVNNADPLIVVDGMPDVDINRINMHDIASVSILKDATSSAVYGSRAANGVILITTKSGKGQDRTKINVSSSLSVERPTHAYSFLADYPRALTIHQRLAAYNTLKSNYNFKDGTIDQWMAMGMIDPLRFPNTDWFDVIMRDGSIQNHNISASGGNEKSNFYISAGVMDQKGLQINNDYSRYNVRINYDAKIRTNVNIGARFSGDWSKYKYALDNGFTTEGTGGGDLQFAIAGITPYDPVTGYYGGVMAYNEDPMAYNPYTVYINSLNRQNRQEANASVYVDWTPVKGLTGRVDYALSYFNQFHYTASIPNRAYNFQTGSFGSRRYVNDNAGITNATNTGYKTQLNGRLNYRKTIGHDHDLSLLFVYSEEYWNSRSQTGSRMDRLHPSLHELDAALTDIQTAGGNSSAEGLRSYIGRLNYAAFDKYLFEANFRYDGSSKFLPGSRYGFFPSAAIGWRFSEEGFIKNFSGNWLSNGKLRISYGGLGNNSGVGRYEQLETLAASAYMIGNSISKGFVYRKMVNRDLSWETTRVLNIGFDLGFLANRLSAEIDYYDRLTTGMNRPSDLSLLLTGAYDAPRKNIGDLRNRGIEGNFTWRDKAGELNYYINLNASYNATVLEKWNEYLGLGETFIDMPYHFVYSYVDRGIAQTWEDVYNAAPQGAAPGDIIREDLNGDGRIDGNDRKANPKYQRDRPTTNFGLNAGMSWRGFDLGILFQGSAGRKDFWINNYNNVMNFGPSRYASTQEHWENPWSVENRDGPWPRYGGTVNRQETSFWLDDLSFLRLKNIQLGYRFPKKWMQWAGIEDIRIYASGENLATFTSYRGLDPEKETNVNDAYPLNKSFSFGINVGL